MTGRAPSGQALAVPATPANAVDGPAGFDPSRGERELMICARVAAASVYTGSGMEAFNNEILDGRKDGIGLVQAARAAILIATCPDALTGCADDQIWAHVPVEALRAAIATEAGTAETEGEQ